MYNREELKNILLQLEGFIDNEALDSYCALVYDNLSQEKQRYKTQAHHFIPVCYYKKPGEKYDRRVLRSRADRDTTNFTVNLSFMEHIRAHYFLAGCTKGEFKSGMALAYVRMINSPKFTCSALTDDELTAIQERYEEVKACFNHFRGKHHTPEWCAQHSLAMKGRVTYERTSDIAAKISSTIKQGYLEGKYAPLSEESRAKRRHIGEANGRYNKKYKQITDGFNIRAIKAEEQIPEGWLLGSPAQFKFIAEFDDTMQVRNVYVNSKCAERVYSSRPTGMIGMVCRGTYHTAYGQYWGFINLSSQSFSDIIEKIKTGGVDLACKYLADNLSILDPAIFSKISADIEASKKPKKVNRHYEKDGLAVNQYLNSEFIATYKSVRQAAMKTGITYDIIKRCCKTNNHAYKEFTFEFAA